MQAGCIVADKTRDNYQKKNRLGSASGRPSGTDLFDLNYNFSNVEVLLAENHGNGEFDRAVTDHKNICTQIVSNYKDELGKVLKLENKLQNSLEEIKNELKMLIPYPEYDNMECKFVRRSS